MYIWSFIQGKRKNHEEEMIEREGDIYMQRLEQEREGKKESEKSLGV